MQVGAVGVYAHGRNILSVVRDHKVHLGCAQDKQDRAVDQSQLFESGGGRAAPLPRIMSPLGHHQR